MALCVKLLPIRDRLNPLPTADFLDRNRHRLFNLGLGNDGVSVFVTGRTAAQKA
jgi:hypothetical protein